jgi:hypothetical protein
MKTVLKELILFLMVLALPAAFIVWSDASVRWSDSGHEYQEYGD